MVRFFMSLRQLFHEEAQTQLIKHFVHFFGSTATRLQHRGKVMAQLNVTLSNYAQAGIAHPGWSLQPEQR